MLTTKYKRETRTELPHTDIYYNGEFLGYITKNTSEFRKVGENWNFTSKSDRFPHYFYTKSRKEMLLKLETQAINCL